MQITKSYNNQILRVCREFLRRRPAAAQAAVPTGGRLRSPSFSGTVRFHNAGEEVTQDGPFNEWILFNRATRTWTTYALKPVPSAPNEGIARVSQTFGDLNVF